MTLRFQDPRIAIIGGGIAGATAAVHLGELGLNVVLMEKSAGLVSGPPICHLHAGAISIEKFPSSSVSTYWSSQLKRYAFIHTL